MFATAAYIDDSTDHFGFGSEMGRVAESLAKGNGFSSPLPSPTGPTAIVGPLYPLLMALIFKLCGVYSTASAVVILTLQCVFSSLTCLFIFLCGRDTVGQAAGKLAALGWAVFPLNIFFTLNRAWETPISALLTAAFFWYMFRLRYSLSALRWAAAGALLTIAVLINASLFVLVVPFGLSALWKNRTRIFRPATAAALTCLALSSPWLIRNYLEFDRFMLRSNFPLEFRFANNEISPGQKIKELHPSTSPYLNQHWHDVGEARFMAEERNLNSQFLTAHPGLYAFAVVNRFVNYWTGAWITPTMDWRNRWSVIIGISSVSLLGLLGVRRMFYSGNSAALMYAGCLFIYPLVYYFTTSQPRFYHAITPLLILPGAFWVLHWKNRIAEAMTAQGRSLPETPARTVRLTL